MNRRAHVIAALDSLIIDDREDSFSEFLDGTALGEAIMLLEAKEDELLATKPFEPDGYHTIKNAKLYLMDVKTGYYSAEMIEDGEAQ